MVRIRYYYILRKIYHKKGVNDGLLFEVTNNQFNPISSHKTKKMAENKIKRLKK